MRLIDGIALEERCKRQMSSEWNKLSVPPSWADAYEQFLVDVENCPTIDAVPVVRCRECKWWKDNDCYNDTHGYFPFDENDFCSQGKRKDGAE